MIWISEEIIFCLDKALGDFPAILNKLLCSIYLCIPHTHASTHTHKHVPLSIIRKGKHGMIFKASSLTDGRVGQSAPKKTLRVRRASVLGAVDHNLSVDPCGSRARCCGGGCWKLRALSRGQRVLFFVEKGDRQEIRKGRWRHMQNSEDQLLPSTVHLLCHLTKGWCEYPIRV